MSVPYLHDLRHFAAAVRVFAVLAAACLCLMPAAVMASTGATTRASFRVYLWPDIVDISGYNGEGQDGGYYYRAPQIAYQERPDDAAKLIDVSAGRLSDAYRYTGAGPLVFFREEQGQDGQVLRVPLAAVSADNLAEETLLIFFPTSAKEGAAYNILPVSAPAKSIPGGQVMVYNLTRQKLALYTGKSVHTLSPGEITLSELGRSEDASVPLRILVDDDGEWVLRHAEKQTIGDDEKLLFFIFPRDAESNRLRVLSINTAS